MLKPKFRDIGKLCHSLDGDIYSALDYDWITNQFPDTERDLIPSECVGLSNSIAKQSYGCSVFYSCLGPADAQGTQNPMQVFYRERYRPESAAIHRPYRISRILINETSSKTEYELVGPLAFYQARYAEGVTGVQPDHAQTLPGLTEQLGQQINQFGYIYGDVQERRETDQYEKLIELILSYVCNGKTVSLWQKYEENEILLKPIKEELFYQIVQKVWEQLPSKSLQMCFSASWGCENKESHNVSKMYTLTSPLEGKFKGDSTPLYLIDDSNWTRFDEWLNQKGPLGWGSYNLNRMQTATQLKQNDIFRSFVEFMNWKLDQGQLENSILYHTQEDEIGFVGFLSHLKDLLTGSKPGRMFSIPYDFENCPTDPFAHMESLSEFNYYQLVKRIKELYEYYQDDIGNKLFHTMGWKCYPINSESMNYLDSQCRKSIDDLRLIYSQSENLKYHGNNLHQVLGAHSVLYQYLQSDYHKWKNYGLASNDCNNLMAWHLDIKWREWYDFYIYYEQEPGYDYTDSNLQKFIEEHEDKLSQVKESETEPWSRFKKKMASIFGAEIEQLRIQQEHIQDQLNNINRLNTICGGRIIFDAHQSVRGTERTSSENPSTHGDSSNTTTERRSKPRETTRNDSAEEIAKRGLKFKIDWTTIIQYVFVLVLTIVFYLMLSRENKQRSNVNSNLHQGYPSNQTIKGSTPAKMNYRKTPSGYLKRRSLKDIEPTPNTLESEQY